MSPWTIPASAFVISVYSVDRVFAFPRSSMSNFL